ncbi:GmrSD restriction endonuclease domain-containing protein [Streptomyces indicus]|uniref:GmrSD restriction endonucleases C-terminal domain-containing protein n=1 Tax=Streptomyces indicus TaxID=417292 RepID=A0A1G8ZJ15_9ACTN|nr:DUF1524 domain-containing protein [Streptomyces indicus]SDK15041.1 hypothetical protein SAMN05421806_10522 [Streptomyces indicus]
MNSNLRTLSVATALLLAAAVLAPASAAAAPSADPEPRFQVRKAVQLLGTMSEYKGTYPAAAFPGWADADHDGCDTRAEVLREEAVAAPRIEEDCLVASGQWYSWYDDRQLTGDPARQVEVHHLVPLKEAWESGAHAWDTATREAYVNDLAAAATLTAVSAAAARDRGDRDPAEWLPPYAPARCAYVADWIATKLRWGLTVDFLEAVKLTEVAQGCPNTPLAVPAR